MGVVGEDAGDVAGDGPVVVGLDGDAELRAGDGGGHVAPEGVDEFADNEGGDFLDVVADLGETDAGDDLRVSFFMERILVEGGLYWDEAAEVMCGRLEGIVDGRVLVQIKQADTLVKRMWFLGVGLYVCGTRVEPASRLEEYYLDHFYEYMVFTVCEWGDVWMLMSILWDRMQEYHEFLGAPTEVAGGEAHL